MFHSAQWDHGHDLTGERVAVIGTGASAIQFVPAIAARTASLSVFQRSAPYVLGKPDRTYRERAKKAFARVPGLLRLSREGNYFSNELRSLGFNTEPRLLFAHRARYRRHLRAVVADPALREKLTPTDPMGCKRILMSNDWYPALQLSQVEVVTDPIAEVRASSARWTRSSWAPVSRRRSSSSR
jgi:cation diffusion facilitator CzcD-associated flavoprotein CzcO